MDTSEFISRLKGRVDGLGGRVYPAADLARLTAQQGAPATTPCAYVVPTGGAGGQHSGQVGFFVQPVDRMYSVLLVVRTDAPGIRALERIDNLIDDIIDAIAGWDPGLVGVFTLRRYQLIRQFPDALSWEITFSITDRIKKATT